MVPERDTTGPRLAIAYVMVALVSVGCSGSERADSFAVVDSAGVRIVTSVAPQWGPDEGWKVNPTPSVDIGAEEDDPDGYLYQVRDAVRWLESIVVINGVTDDLRVFNLDGSYKRTIGRQGGGPGEFNRLMFLDVLNGDSILTWDFSNDRVSVFDQSGEFVRSTWLEGNDRFGAFVWPEALLATRRLLTMSRQALGQGTNESGRSIEFGIAALHDVTGQLDAILGSEPRRERMQMIRGDMITTLEAPFSRELQTTSWLDGYCLGFASTFEIRCRRDLTDSTATYLRLERPRTPVTDNQVDGYIEARLASASGNYARAFRRMVDDMVFPDSFPAFGDLFADPSGNLWVERYETGEAVAPSWQVFNSQGHWRGTVELPERLRVFRFYEDAVLGVWKDSLDVEHVRLHELIK